MLTLLATPGSGEAQEFRPDIKADGVLIGAGSGAAAGVVISLLSDEDICSPGTCAYLGAVVGGLIGLVIDRDMAHPRPVTAGSWVDDGLGNGALVGALSGIGLTVLEVRRRCGTGPGRVQCTRSGILVDLFRATWWMALVGVIVDAAIPSRLQIPGSAVPARSQRRLRVGFDLRL
jgi:hypothetical protein